MRPHNAVASVQASLRLGPGRGQAAGPGCPPPPPVPRSASSPTPEPGATLLRGRLVGEGGWVPRETSTGNIPLVSSPNHPTNTTYEWPSRLYPSTHDGSGPVSNRPRAAPVPPARTNVRDAVTTPLWPRCARGEARQAQHATTSAWIPLALRSEATAPTRALHRRGSPALVRAPARCSTVKRRALGDGPVLRRRAAGARLLSPTGPDRLALSTPSHPLRHDARVRRCRPDPQRRFHVKHPPVQHPTLANPSAPGARRARTTEHAHQPRLPQPTPRLPPTSNRRASEQAPPALATRSGQPARPRHGRPARPAAIGRPQRRPVAHRAVANRAPRHRPSARSLLRSAAPSSRSSPAPIRTAPPRRSRAH